jgi:hypothetical protein
MTQGIESDSSTETSMPEDGHDARLCCRVVLYLDHTRVQLGVRES